MGLFSDEKRKNDSPRRFQWWLLAVGIAIGVVGTLIIVGGGRGSSSSSSNVSNLSDEAIQMTATHIIEQATQMVGTAQDSAVNAIATWEAPSGDPLQITATTIIQQATQTAAALTAQAGS